MEILIKDICPTCGRGGVQAAQVFVMDEKEIDELEKSVVGFEEDGFSREDALYKSLGIFKDTK